MREGCTLRGYYLNPIFRDKEVTLVADGGDHLVVEDLDDVDDQDDIANAIEDIVCTCPPLDISKKEYA